MLKYPLCLLLCLALLLGAAGCGKKKAGTDGSGTTTADGSTTPQTWRSEETLRVVLIDTASATTGKVYDVEAVNARMKDLGFHIGFEIFYASGRSSDELMDKCRKHVRENIDKNAVFITYIADLAEELSREGVLQDFTGKVADIAPTYASRPEVANYIGKHGSHLLPFNFIYLDMSPSTLAVLVREDIAAANGRIETATDYIKLLRRLKDSDPAVVPGLIFDVNRAACFSLFMPEMGYYPDEGNGNITYTLKGNGAYPTFLLPEARAAIEDFAAVRRDGLFDLFSPGLSQTVPNFGDYPTVVLPAYTFMDVGLYNTMGANLNDFDARGYRMYMLYDGMLPYADRLNNALYADLCATAFAGKNADVTEFIYFLQFLETEADYRKLFYEGDDAQAIRDALSVFDRKQFNPVPTNAPKDYREMLADYKYARQITFTAEDWADIMGYSLGIKQEDTFFYLYYSHLYNKPVSDEKKFNDALDKFMAAQASYESMLNEYAALYQRALDNSEVR